MKLTETEVRILSVMKTCNKNVIKMRKTDKSFNDINGILISYI